MGLSRTIAAVFMGVLCAVALVASAGAVVPPRDCGRMTLAGKRIQVKVDQISCRDGKAYARGYVERRVTPRGYRCTTYSVKKNRVQFMCRNGARVFLGIRR